MSTTQIFVELLIIGFGVVIWIALLIAGISELTFCELVEFVTPSLVPPLVAIAYVFGILLDRASYSFFNCKKNKTKDRILVGLSDPPPPILERIVHESSQPLSHMINYNRSRSRICRSWFVNFLFIGVTFLAWQCRMHLSTLYLIIVPGGMFILATVSYRISEMLEEDYYNNLKWSYEYISKYKPYKNEK